MGCKISAKAFIPFVDLTQDGDHAIWHQIYRQIAKIRCMPIIWGMCRGANR
jgi:hypothetical protein